MPCSQVDEGILTAQEMAELLREDKDKGKDKKGMIEVEVVDPQGRRYGVSLKRIKAGGTNSCSYTIGRPWNDIKKANGFKEGMKLEVWAVRRESGQLSFHLTAHP